MLSCDPLGFFLVHYRLVQFTIIFFVAKYDFKTFGLSPWLKRSELSQHHSSWEAACWGAASGAQLLVLIWGHMKAAGCPGREESQVWVALLEERAQLTRFWFLTWAHFDFSVIQYSQGVSACQPRLARNCCQFKMANRNKEIKPCYFFLFYVLSMIYH